MKFDLSPERLSELEENVSELERWVHELEELDLERYGPIFYPSPKSGPDNDA